MKEHEESLFDLNERKISTWFAIYTEKNFKTRLCTKCVGKCGNRHDTILWRISLRCIRYKS